MAQNDQTWQTQGGNTIGQRVAHKQLLRHVQVESEPQQLYALTDRIIIQMAKNHDITCVDQEAKNKLRIMAMVTLEGVIDAAKICAHARCGYPIQDAEKGNGVLTIDTEDIVAALHSRGISEYSFNKLKPNLQG